MQRLGLGIVLATLAGYLWGMLYWGFNPLPYTAWKTSRDDVAAGRALLEFFPESGTYYVPGLHHDDAKIERLYEAGPVGFVHLTSREGRSRTDPRPMWQGFLLIGVTCSLLALLLRLGRAALPSYGSRVAACGLVGALAAISIDIGDSVWWFIPLEWKLHQAVYDFSAFVVPGLVLARFADEGSAAGEARPGSR